MIYDGSRVKDEKFGTRVAFTRHRIYGIDEIASEQAKPLFQASWVIFSQPEEI